MVFPTVRLITGVSALGLLLALSPVRAGGVSALFSDDGRTVLVEAPGVKTFTFGSLVRFTTAGEERVLGAARGEVLGRGTLATVATPAGPAVATSVTYGDGRGDFAYTLTLTRLRDRPVVGLGIEFHNRSGSDAHFDIAEMINTGAGEGGKLEWADGAGVLVTPLMLDGEAVRWAEADGQFSEAAMVYDKQGAGFLAGPAGPPEAHTVVEVRGAVLKVFAEMDGVLVKAGETRRSEPVIVSFEPPDDAAGTWTRWVAETHGARFDRQPVYGWCSWYNRTTEIDEAHVRDVLAELAGHPDVFGRGVLQIDDGYQKMDGDWAANAKFPSGMAALAGDIRAKGWKPGIWFAPLMISPEHPWSRAHPDALQKDPQGISSFMNANPFHPDGAHWVLPDHPESKKFLSGIIRQARADGYQYIKLDFNGVGTRFHDPTKTRMQILRELYRLYREAAGDQMYILACLGQPQRGVIGYADAARVGPDAHPAHFEKCLKSVLRFQIFDNVWWRNDPDVSYLAADLPSRGGRVGAVRQGEGMWRTWHNIVTLVGGTTMNSEPLEAPDVKAVWRHAAIMRPGSSEPARLLTLGLSPDNTIFGFSARRPYGDFGVYNLYNPAAGRQPVTLEFAAAGLPGGTECLVFDFWENKVIARATDRYTTGPLPSLSSALLRFTPVAAGRPVLVGSNLHLSIGATEIGDIRATAGGLEIRLTDAGAPDGSLTFHSEKALAADGAENCAVAAVESLGDNLWRVDITGRRWGAPQLVRLRFAPAGRD